MTAQSAEIAEFLRTVHPYDILDAEEAERLVQALQIAEFRRGDEIYTVGQALHGIFVIQEGSVEIRDRRGGQLSLLGPRNSFGERGLMRDGVAVTSAYAAADSRVLIVPVAEFRHLLETQPAVAQFFDRTGRDRTEPPSLATVQVRNLLTGPPIGCPPDTPIREAARQMRARNISCLAVVEDGRISGIVTTTDLSHRVVAEATDTSLPVSTIMTPRPITLPPSALASDVLHIMHEKHIGHLPIEAEDGSLMGMVTQTDLTRLQAVTSAQFVSEIASGRTPEGLARTTAQIPQLLVQLVGSGNRHEVVTRLITDIADAVTRRLLALAEDKLGPPPAPYAWLACGSQGRREQTGVSDQDNCLFIDDRATDADMAYFEKLAAFVCDGLNTCGYYLCPGDMMATNPRWRQRVAVWRSYFEGWIAKPSPEAQMLASVMFDLRVIGGEPSLFEEVNRATLKTASANSIFVSHMISNSLKHTPPLGLLRGFATIRSGEHKNAIDLKHNGVVPVVDLARIYALQGQIPAVNTRARLVEAAHSNVLSRSGASDLLDAYDLIAQTRLDHQAGQIRRGGQPDNYLLLTEMSDFERSHLRDAFVVIKTLQSAIGHGRGMLG